MNLLLRRKKYRLSKRVQEFHLSCERDLELFLVPKLLPTFKGTYTVLSEEATETSSLVLC